MDVHGQENPDEEAGHDGGDVECSGGPQSFTLPEEETNVWGMTRNMARSASFLADNNPEPAIC